MKKLSIITIIAFVLINTPIYSQEAPDTIKSDTSFSEIKLNGLVLILGVFEPTYEYNFNEESAIGISVFIPFDKDVTDEIKYHITPYYRMYFGKNNNASGFFGEAFGMLNNSNRDLDFDIFNIDEDNFKTDFALGFGFGGKWVNKSGFIFELSLGIGRNLFHHDDDDPIVGKGGISLGYRF